MNVLPGHHLEHKFVACPSGRIARAHFFAAQDAKAYACFFKNERKGFGNFLCPLVEAAGAAGMAMGIDGDVSIGRLAISFLPFFLGYGFGQALTDCFQTDTDKLSAPYRPLSQGVVSVRNVLAVSLGGLLV